MVISTLVARIALSPEGLMACLVICLERPIHNRLVLAVEVNDCGHSSLIVVINNQLIIFVN